MPYQKLSQLPPAVQKHLPLDAQKVFMAAFNTAVYDEKKDEEAAFKIAWAAVRKAGYQKVGDKWVKRGKTGTPPPPAKDRAGDGSLGAAFPSKMSSKPSSPNAKMPPLGR